MPIARTAAAVALAALVAACSVEQRPVEVRVNPLIAASYGGADRLLTLMQGRLDPAKPVLVATLADVSDLSHSTAFGRIVAEQIGSRLVNSGYTVREVKLRRDLAVRQGGGEFVLSRDVRRIDGAGEAQAIVAGTYTVAETEVYVNVKLLRADNGKILAADDFVVAKDPDVAALLGPDSRSGWY